MPAQQTIVINVRDHYDRGGAIFIGRPSKWGNPYHLKNSPDRITCVEDYARYLATRPDLLAALPEIRGKMLKCFCSPEPCHGDVLALCADITGMNRINDYVYAIMTRCHGPAGRSVALLCVPEEHRRSVREYVTIKRQQGKIR